MGVRHRGRELAFQILFQTDQTGDKVNAVIARFQDMKHVNAEAAGFAKYGKAALSMSSSA